MIESKRRVYVVVGYEGVDDTEYSYDLGEELSPVWSYFKEDAEAVCQYLNRMVCDAPSKNPLVSHALPQSFRRLEGVPDWMEKEYESMFQELVDWFNERFSNALFPGTKVEIPPEAGLYRKFQRYGVLIKSEQSLHEDYNRLHGETGDWTILDGELIECPGEDPNEKGRVLKTKNLLITEFQEKTTRDQLRQAGELSQHRRMIRELYQSINYLSMNYRDVVENGEFFYDDESSLIIDMANELRDYWLDRMIPFFDESDSTSEEEPYGPYGGSVPCRVAPMYLIANRPERIPKDANDEAPWDRFSVRINQEEYDSLFTFDYTLAKRYLDQIDPDRERFCIVRTTSAETIKWPRFGVEYCGHELVESDHGVRPTSDMRKLGLTVNDVDGFMDQIKSIIPTCAQFCYEYERLYSKEKRYSESQIEKISYMMGDLLEVYHEYLSNTDAEVEEDIFNRLYSAQGVVMESISMQEFYEQLPKVYLIESNRGCPSYPNSRPFLWARKMPTDEEIRDSLGRQLGIRNSSEVTIKEITARELVWKFLREKDRFLKPVDLEDLEFDPEFT